MTGAFTNLFYFLCSVSRRKGVRRRSKFLKGQPTFIEGASRCRLYIFSENRKRFPSRKSLESKYDFNIGFFCYALDQREIPTELLFLYYIYRCIDTFERFYICFYHHFLYLRLQR